MYIPVGGPCFHVRLDFHNCLFLSLKNGLRLIAARNARVCEPLANLPRWWDWYRRSRLEPGLHLQALCHRLVVLRLSITSFHAALHLQAASYRLVVVRHNPTSFHVRFDFHGCLFPFLENLLPVAPLQVSALPAPLGQLFFNHGQSAYRKDPPWRRS